VRGGIGREVMGHRDASGKCPRHCGTRRSRRLSGLRCTNASAKRCSEDDGRPRNRARGSAKPDQRGEGRDRWKNQPSQPKKKKKKKNGSAAIRALRQFGGWFLKLRPRQRTSEAAPFDFESDRTTAGEKVEAARAREPRNRLEASAGSARLDRSSSMRTPTPDRTWPPKQ